MRDAEGVPSNGKEEEEEEEGTWESLSARIFLVRVQP